MKRLLPFLISTVLCTGSVSAEGERLWLCPIELCSVQENVQDVAAAQQTITVVVSGTVTDAETGEPLVGVTVVASSGQAVITSATGAYTVSVESGARLMFQYVGYGLYSWDVPADSPQQTHNVLLERNIEAIEDVVVVAYGVREKGTIAGSVSTVGADKLANSPAASFDQALQGLTPGLTVMSNSGEPSGGSTFSIRGTNSINSGTSPLFILDGMMISSSAFTAIDQADIESISVLKDASSTSIYGARAANGVIIITTKRGKTGKANVSYRMKLGFSDLADGNWAMMNTAERIRYEKEVGLTDGKDYDRLSKININWRDEIFSNFAPLQSHELQVNGATDRFNYFVSGGYYSQDGLTSDSYFKRIHLRANAEVKATDWLKVGTNTMLSYETFSRSEAGEYYTNTPISASRFMLPYNSPYKSNGQFNSVNDGTWKGSGENPLEWAANNPMSNKRYHLLSTTFLEAKPIRGLTLRSQFGVDYNHSTVDSRSMASYAPNAGLGRVSKSSSDQYTLTITNTANYAFDPGTDHKFNFLLGQEGVDYHGDTFAVAAEGFVNDKLDNLSNATTARSWSDSYAEFASVSVFGRAEYSYKARYYADFSIRGDWSSRFGANRRGGAFWSVGFMWNILGENFVSNDTKKWLTNAQIAVSTGTSGNSEIPYYDHLALVTGSVNYMDEAGLAPLSKGNPNLSWEELWSTNLAFRLGFWNRLSFELEFYNKNTSKMLMQVPVSFSDAGYGFLWDNVGKMVNRGVELSLNADVIKTKSGFTWSVSGNASYNFNKITYLYAGADSYMSGTTKYQVGRSYGEFFYNRFAGVNPANGDALWYDKNGNITNKFDEDDKVFLGKSFIAPWQGGFGTTLSWKGISLSVLFSWVADRWMINNDRYFEEGQGLFDAQNQSKRMLYDRWKKPGDVTDIPRHGISPQFDTHLLEDASFVRLKNLTIGYSFPRQLLAKTKFISGLNIYVQAQNLFTFTKFTGLDPEALSPVYAAQYPISRQFSFGLGISF